MRNVVRTLPGKWKGYKLHEGLLKAVVAILIPHGCLSFALGRKFQTRSGLT